MISFLNRFIDRLEKRFRRFRGEGEDAPTEEKRWTCPVCRGEGVLDAGDVCPECHGAGTIKE